MHFSTGFIYKITCKLDKNFIFVGSTFTSIIHRWKSYLCQYNKYLENGEKYMACYPYFSKHGINNFDIELLNSYTVCRETRRDFKHLRMYNQLYLNKYKNAINIKKAFNPLAKLDYKAKSKIYRESNKQYFKQKNKVYRDQNKNYFKAYRKKYCQDDK